MATMREVAARAGVSAKTVSRVFNNDPHVLPATRKRVEEALAALDYVPNALATSFRSGRTSVIGVAVPDIGDPFFTAIARSIEDVARAHGMSTLVVSLGDAREEERRTVESLLGRRLNGLVIAPIGADHSWMRRWSTHTPLVFVDRGPHGFTTDTYTENDEEGTRLVVEHMLSHGHRRIAFFGDKTDISTEAGRLKSWRATLSAHGVEPAEELVEVHLDTAEATVAALARQSRLEAAATAIFSANARTTMHLARALRGNTLAYAGFGDFPMADMLTPAVTVVAQDPARLGRLAAERILARLDGDAEGSPAHTSLGVSLRVRESCGCREG